MVENHKFSRMAALSVTAPNSCKKGRRVVLYALSGQGTGPEGQEVPHTRNKRRVRPGERLRQRIDQLLSDGIEGHRDVLGALVRVRQVRDWAGEGPFHPRLMTFLRGHGDVLGRLAVEMYTRGPSVRDIEEALREASGDRLLSRSAVSALSDTLWEYLQAFCERDLSV